MTAQPRSFDDMSLPTGMLQSPQARSRATPAAVLRRRTKKGPSAEYWFVFAVCLSVFLVVLTLERALPPSWRTVSAQFNGSAVWTEAMAAAHRYTDIAFQG